LYARVSLLPDPVGTLYSQFWSVGSG